MKSRKNKIYNMAKDLMRIYMVIAIIAGLNVGTANAYSNPVINKVQARNSNLTARQAAVIRSFLIENSNKIPNLNLSQPQIDAILSYFDNDPNFIRVNLTPQQVQAIQVYFINNYNEIANMRLSNREMTRILTIVSNNSAGFSSLINNNPEIAQLIRSLAPQINQLTTLNQQWNAIIFTSRTAIPELNVLLTI